MNVTNILYMCHVDSQQQQKTTVAVAVVMVAVESEAFISRTTIRICAMYVSGQDRHSRIEIAHQKRLPYS